MRNIFKSNISAHLIGHRNDFALEARLFHGICVISFLILFVNAIINYLIDIPELTILMIPCLILLVTLYYLSRYRFMLNLSVSLFCFFSYVAFAINFYYNSGINGPSLIIFTLLLYITISLTPKKQYFFWVLLNMVIVSLLLVVQFNYPDFIPKTYQNEYVRYVDAIYAYVSVTFLVFLITSYIRNSYYNEKILSDQKSLKLEQANEVRNKLLSIVAHDLRSPLNSIQNFLGLLAEIELTDEEKMMIKKSLFNETKNTQQMLSNVLSWSKTQLTGVSVNPAKVNLKETLKVSLELLKTTAAEKSILFENNLLPQLCVWADPNMIDIIVRNMVNNAIKFTEGGGRIVISSESSEKYCTIIISDNGKGIPLEKQPEIFSLKVQSTFGTNNEKGVGLGLVLCHEFITLLGGTVWFDSKVNEGTTFYIRLDSCRPKA
jgi:two-component system sensor histidine kinase/response regulator